MSKIALACCLLLLIGAWCPNASAEEYALEKAEKYRLSGQYRLALEEAERLLAGPARDNGSVHYFYAFMLYRLKGDNAKVKHHLQEGLRMDPYSWDTDDARRLLAKLEKEEKERLEVASIPGAKVGLILEDGTKVEAVEENSSAAKAGILPGDKIVFIDNVSTSFMSTRAVASRLAGPPSSRVAVTINRNGTKFSRFLYRTKTGSSVAHTSGANAKTHPASVTSSNKPAAPTALNDSSSIPIEVFRRTKTTEDCEKRVKQALAYVPASARETLRHNGVTIIIVQDVLTAEPHLANQKPRGYTFGGYDNCGGIFFPRDKKIYIAERFSIGNAPLQENPYTLWTALHEIGHAFDHVGMYSNSESFTKAYEDDAKYLNNELRIKYSYFLQSDKNGPSEMFAEIFSAVVAPNEDLRAVALSHSFPRCTKVVKESLGVRDDKK